MADPRDPVRVRDRDLRARLPALPAPARHPGGGVLRPFGRWISGAAVPLATGETLRVVDLGKRFFHTSKRRPTTLQERCVGRNQERGPEGEFWGLRHVDFALHAGSALGVVGSNGAGKSTLLRLLSGIGRPDEGSFTLARRPNSLLDLDCGFHPELTGRENVFVSAVIAGVRRRDVARLLDEIVAFSGLEQFIDDPLRTYSSGMKARLGFSISLSVAPSSDVMLVDEVLAVGDAEFGERCLERISRYVENGGSLIFVSHALTFMARICDRALWLNGGHVEMIGTPEAVARGYLASQGVAPERQPALESAAAPA